MFKKMCSIILFNLMISFSLHAVDITSFDQAFEELSETPVSQLDFRIQILEYRIKKFKKKVYTIFEDAYFNENFLTSTRTLKCCDNIKCYKDRINNKLIICEVLVDFDSGNFYGKTDIKKRVENTKFIYKTIFGLAKEIIHDTIEPSNIKIIIKREKSLKEENLPDEYNEVEQFLMSYTAQEETLVIWENGIPFYQDAFFAD